MRISTRTYVNSNVCSPRHIWTSVYVHVDNIDICERTCVATHTYVNHNECPPGHMWMSVCVHVDNIDMRERMRVSTHTYIYRDICPYWHTWTSVYVHVIRKRMSVDARMNTRVRAVLSLLSSMMMCTSAVLHMDVHIVVVCVHGDIHVRTQRKKIT